MNGDTGGDILFGADGSDVMWGGRGSSDIAHRDRSRRQRLARRLRVRRPRWQPRTPAPGIVTGGADVIDYLPRVGVDPAGLARTPSPSYDDGEGGGETLRQFHQGVDWVYGGWDRDVMEADLSDNGPHLGDRLVDWTGAYNLYVHCNSAYGGYTDLRTQSPSMESFLENLAFSLGAGASLADVQSNAIVGVPRAGPRLQARHQGQLGPGVPDDARALRPAGGLRRQLIGRRAIARRPTTSRRPPGRRRRQPAVSAAAWSWWPSPLPLPRLAGWPSGDWPGGTAGGPPGPGSRRPRPGRAGPGLAGWNLRLAGRVCRLAGWVRGLAGGRPSAWPGGSCACRAGSAALAGWGRGLAGWVWPTGRVGWPSGRVALGCRRPSRSRRARRPRPSAAVRDLVVHGCGGGRAGIRGHDVAAGVGCGIAVGTGIAVVGAPLASAAWPVRSLRRDGRSWAHDDRRRRRRRRRRRGGGDRGGHGRAVPARGDG